MYGRGASGGHMPMMGERVEHPARNVFLDGTDYHKRTSAVNKIAPAPPDGYYPPYQQHHQQPIKAFEPTEEHGIVFEALKPVIYLLRAMGLFPVAVTTPGVFKVTPPLLIYSCGVFAVILAYTAYIKYDKVEIVRTAEGKFEEAVIDYLFSVYLLPVVILPVSLYESRKMAKVYTDWFTFEGIYKRIAGKPLPLFLGNKTLLVALVLPIFGVGTMVVTHITMLNFKFLQVVPYCLINTITYLVGGIWYVQSDVIGEIATTIADDFEKALKHIGPSSMVADYRSLWMLLSRLIREISNAMCYAVTFLCLYLFLIITLTVYGLLSKLQEGFGVKDIGLTVTAAFAVALLYFICDEAHYASNCVRVYFQKKLLLVELSWMNEDAQQEINMFLRATEMNPTDMNLGGFFDVNRNLFKSLLATMVTYLVVLLQFQISIPQDTSISNTSTTVTTMLPITTAQ